VTDRYPKLCGGIFFVLLLQALKQKNSARQHYKGERDRLSDPEVLIGLIRVFYPEYIDPPAESFKQDTSAYKNFRKAHGDYLPFNKVPIITAFDNRIKADYRVVLASMCDFANNFLEIETSGVWLVKALIELIEGDCGEGGIDDTQAFYCLENGKEINKPELMQLTEVCLPAFLLGIWHFIILNRRDNKPGDVQLSVETIGSNIKRAIAVTMPETDATADKTESAFINEDEPTEEYEELHEEQYTDSYEGKNNRVFINNAPVFQQFGANSKQISVNNGATLIINND
jgi:hypothetical protein